MFNEDSGLVYIFVKRVREGTTKREDVPLMSNLKEIVYRILDRDIEQ